MKSLPIIQKTYDLIKWYIPILTRLPRNHKYALGERLTTNLYSLLDSLITAQYESEKLTRLQAINTQLEIIRYQTRLLHEFELIHAPRYEHASKLTNDIGTDLGGWIRQQRGRQDPSPA
jgi:hypothetical protein